MKIALLSIFLYSFLTLNAREYKKEALKIKSDVFDSEIHLIIFKPVLINKTEPLQAIYMLDGELTEDRFKQLEKFFNDNESDNIIVCLESIGSISKFEILKEKKEFQNSLKTEIIPNIESNLNIIRRFIIGHKDAGAFQFYSFTKSPGLFQRYYCIDPTPFKKYVKRQKLNTTDRYLLNLLKEEDEKIEFLVTLAHKDSLELGPSTEKIIYKNLKYNSFSFRVSWRNFGLDPIDR